MVLGDLGRARRLAGNPAVSNVSDADITTGLTYGTSQVIRITGKTDWATDTLNPSYDSVVQAVEYFASSMIRDRFQDQMDISTEHFNRANTLCEQIADSLASGVTGSGGSGGSAAIAHRNYRSYPLNPNAVIYRSMLSTGQELVGTASFDSTNQ